MQAVVCRSGELKCEEVADPVPATGEVLTRTLCCGICGSDLHALHASAAAPAAAGLVFGHEFCAEILDVGPGTPRRFRPGTRVVSAPVARGDAGFETIGFSARFPGGFGERMVLTESLLLEVPNGLSAADAAMTEPFAVGEHAVAQSAAGPGNVHLVIGCGPVGLAVITALRHRQLGPIIACDPSPHRRALAVKLGAHDVVDPGHDDPHGSWSAHGLSGDAASRSVLADDSTGRRAVIFECVGKTGMIHDIMAGAPKGAQIIVAGACLDPDRFNPIVGIVKRLELKFVLGYTRNEFGATLHKIAEGLIEPATVVTGRVPLIDVPAAFAELVSPVEHCKILVDHLRN